MWHSTAELESRSVRSRPGVEVVRVRDHSAPRAPRPTRIVPKLSPHRTDLDEPTLTATLGPFVCTWDDLAQVQPERAAAPVSLRPAALLFVLGAALLGAVAPPF